MRWMLAICLIVSVGCATDLSEKDFPCSPGYPCASGFDCVDGTCVGTSQASSPSAEVGSEGEGEGEMPIRTGEREPDVSLDTTPSRGVPGGPGDDPGGPEDGSPGGGSPGGGNPGGGEEENDEAPVAEPSGGNLGDPCESHGDCYEGEDKAGLCLILEDGGICTWECDRWEPDCPSGWNCATVTSWAGSPIYNCLPEGVGELAPGERENTDTAAEPGASCQSKADCGSSGDVDWVCLDIPGLGQNDICTWVCESNDQCPDSSYCGGVGLAGSYCLPDGLGEAG